MANAHLMREKRKRPAGEEKGATEREKSALPTYTMIFTDKDQVRAQDVFTVEYDMGALLIADWLFDACSELYDGYELWRGTRRLKSLPELGVGGLSLAMRSSVDAMRIAQEIVLEREYVLAQASSAIARSKQFIRERNRLEVMTGRKRLI
jgi:hypothetical protein